MFRRNTFFTAITLVVVVVMVSGMCLIPVPAAASSRNLLVNSEYKDAGAGWELGEYGTVDAKVTREGYPSVKLTVAKAKAPVDAKIGQALPADSWAAGDTLTFSAYLARGKNPAFTKKTLPVLALYAVVNGERTLFPSAEIKKLGDIKEAGTKNKTSAWSRFSVTMTVPQGATEVGCLLTFLQNGVMYMAQPKVERGDTASDWFPDAGHKEIAGDGTVLVGTMGGEGFLLSLPAGAYTGVSEIAVKAERADDAPAMPYAVPVGGALAVETGGPVRLQETATLIYAYDPAVTPDPLMLCLGYFDGEEWSYIPAVSVDTQAHTLTFPIHHFSDYYPAQFGSELDAAKHYAPLFAARKVMGENGGDPKLASQAVADYVASKLGLGEDQFSRLLLANIAADEDIIQMMDQLQTQGKSDRAYEYVVGSICEEFADRLIEKRTGITFDEGAPVTATEENFKNTWTLIRLASGGSEMLGTLWEGDAKGAGKQFLTLVADNTGLLGDMAEYVVQGIADKQEVWENEEVENAYRVFKNGSTGTLFGYGAVDAGNFDEVWDNMGSASRELCAERIAQENDARRLLGMPYLTPKEEDFFREKTRKELKSEFERRQSREADIERETENLELIFEELDAYHLLDRTSLHRGFGGDGETLKGRMGKLQDLVQRIYKDLDVKKVYAGSQLTYETGGGISAMEMASMIFDYFSSSSPKEAQARLREHYEKFGVELPEEEIPAYPEASALNGSWSSCTITITELDPALVEAIEAAGESEGCAEMKDIVGTSQSVPMSISMGPDGSGTIDFGDSPVSAQYSNGSITASGSSDGAAYSLSASVSLNGETISLSGTMKVTEPKNGFGFTYSWTAIK